MQVKKLKTLNFSMALNDLFKPPVPEKETEQEAPQDQNAWNAMEEASGDLPAYVPGQPWSLPDWTQ